MDLIDYFIITCRILAIIPLMGFVFVQLSKRHHNGVLIKELRQMTVLWAVSLVLLLVSTCLLYLNGIDFDTPSWLLNYTALSSFLVAIVIWYGAYLYFKIRRQK